MIMRLRNTKESTKNQKAGRAKYTNILYSYYQLSMMELTFLKNIAVTKNVIE